MNLTAGVNSVLKKKMVMMIMMMMMMIDHYSQTRIVGKVDGQFLHARWWL